MKRPCALISLTLIFALLNWVPADENAWTYAAANDDWNFDSSTDPVK